MESASGQNSELGRAVEGSAVLRPPPVSVIAGPVRPTVFLLALPVLGEQVLYTFVGLFDVWLAGRISAAATSAVGLAAYVAWLVSMLVLLVGTGTTALVSRHTGGGRLDEANHDTNQSLTLAAIAGVALLALFVVIAPWIARYSNMTGDAFDLTVRYLRFDAIGHPLLSLGIVGSAALRGIGDMRTPLRAFALVNVVNIIASSLFVFGFGWGVDGIVGGTVLARCSGGLMVVYLLLQGRAGLKINRRELRIVTARAMRILRIGGPAAVDGAIMWTGHFLFLAIVARVAEGQLARASFAAHIIAVRVESLTYLPAVAWAIASATMIGQSLGAGNPRRARRAGHEAAAQCILLSIGIAIFFHFGAAWIYAWMTDDPLVRRIGTRPFSILALLQPCTALSIVYIGGLRGAGDTRVPLLITLLGAMIRLPIGYYFGIVLGWGLLGAWFGMFGDMLWRATGATLRFIRGRWVRTTV